MLDQLYSWIEFILTVLPLVVPLWMPKARRRLTVRYTHSKRGKDERTTFEMTDDRT